jgi:PIN domain nuclease of toxin-antitoxin system
MMADGACDLAVSSVSVYEVGNKHRLGKLDLSATDLLDGARALGIPFLSPSDRVMANASQLVWDHRDPFDRIIAAHALQFSEGRVITADKAFDRAPGITRIWDGG